MTKKLIALLLALLLIVACFVGCAAKEQTNNNDGAANTAADAASSDDTAEGSAEKIKIAFVANGATLWEYPKSSINFYTELQDKYNFELVVFDAQGDAGKQATLVGDAVAQGCDAITIIPVDEKAVIPACTEAMEAGVPVFNLGNVDMGEEYAGVAFVSEIGAGSSLVASEIVGQAFVDNLEPGDKVVEIIGVAGTSEAEQRSKVWREMCEEKGIEIIDTQATDWDVSKALEIMQNYLVQHDRIDGVFCQWDDGAESAVKALESAGRLDGTFVAAIDGDTIGFNLIRDGKMYCTAAQLQGEICEKAVQTTLAYLNGEEVESYVVIPYVLVTKDNVDDYTPW